MAGDNSSRREGSATRPDLHDDEAGAWSSRPAAQTAGLESDIRLTLPARPENVAVVRHVLGAIAGALHLPPAVTDDMRLAVTEACTNVVRHAYPDGAGTIDVLMRPSGRALDVIVSDSGRGIAPSRDMSGPGLGLSLIAALADSLEIERTASAGSRLVMSFLRKRPTPAMGLA